MSREQRSDHNASGVGPGAERYVLRLYVTGRSPNSSRAVANIKRVCERHLAGRYDLRIIDLYQQPELARGQQIIAAPTLVKELPLPVKRIVGDMSDEQRVLNGLDLEQRSVSHGTAEEE